jgi:hypothetical protein
VEWTGIYDLGYQEYAEDVIELNNGYAVVGYAVSATGGDHNVYVIRTNAVGDTLWTKSIGAPDTYEQGHAIVATNDGGYAIAGYTWDRIVGDHDAYLVKLAYDPTGVGEKPIQADPRISIRCHPNPFNPLTTIVYQLPTQSHVTLAIFDVTGKRLDTLIEGIHPAGERVYSWNAAGYPTGVYFIRLETTGKTQVTKAVLLK